MRLHYQGKYSLDPDSLPHGEHKPGAVAFREPKDSKTLAIIANIGALVLVIVFGVIGYFRCADYFGKLDLLLAAVVSVLIGFPHEFLHAICFREDVYLYTNMKQGLLFVVGPESMSKARFIFMSLLPNIVFGFIPYIIGMIFPQCVFLIMFGALAIGMGFGDYLNVFNAATQMPKGSKTYMYKFNSLWFMPE